MQKCKACSKQQETHWVSVADTCNILSRSTVLQSQGSLVDELTSSLPLKNSWNKIMSGGVAERMQINHRGRHEISWMTNRVDHVDTQHAISLLVSQNLDETLGLLVGASTAVGSHGEHANLVVDALTKLNDTIGVNVIRHSESE